MKPGEVPMHEPLAYFITCATYGTWLPGDQRGWIEYRQGWKLPAIDLETNCRSRMAEGSCLLTVSDREAVVAQLEETCRFREWTLYGADCRSNHFHVVVGANNADPKKIRMDLKTWCTRRLKKQSEPSRKRWWAEGGSTRWVWDEESLEKVVSYFTEAQDRKGLDILARRVSEGSASGNRQGDRG